MGLRLITPPTNPPIALAELKAMLRVDHNNDDAMLTAYTGDATQWVEIKTGRRLMPQTWEYVIDAFPVAEIKLPLRPVLSIASIKYDDIEGFEQTLAPAEYYLDNVSDWAWLFPSVAWPSTLSAINSARIQFIAGFADASRIPGPMKSAVRLKVQEAYEQTNQEDELNVLLAPHWDVCV